MGLLGQSLLNKNVSGRGAAAAAAAAPGGGGGAAAQCKIPGNAPSNEDMYMLKSRMLPQGCPVGGCGTGMSNTKNISPGEVPPDAGAAKAERPCPPCDRCPEPAFDCKKVPNYNSAATNQYLPRPVLASFSQFGM